MTTTETRSPADAVRAHLAEIGAANRTISDPDAIGLEVRSNPQIWERVHAITERPGGVYFVRTHNYSYRSIPTWDLRIAQGEL